jgi:hypothetical protein
MARIQQNTTDPAQLLVPVLLRTPGGDRYTSTAPASVSGSTVTFTLPAGGGSATRTLISRGNGRYEMQLLAADVTTIGNGWVDVIDSATRTWQDFCDNVEIYA